MAKEHPGKSAGTTAAAIGRAAGAAAAGAGVAGAAAGAAAGAIHETQQINTQTADPGPFIPKAAWIDAEERCEAIQAWITGVLTLPEVRGPVEKKFTDWGEKWLATKAVGAAFRQIARELSEQVTQEIDLKFAQEAVVKAGQNAIEKAVAAEAAKDAAPTFAAESEAADAALAAAEADTALEEAGTAAIEAAALPASGFAPVLAGGSGGVVLAILVVYLEMALLGALARRFASDPPDPGFRDVYRPYRIEFPPVTPSGTMPQWLAAALDAALRSQLESVSLCMAVLVSLERHQGAKAANDDDAANSQLVAYVNYAIEAAQALGRTARLLIDFAAARRAWEQPDVAVTADQIRVAQERLGSDGLPDELLAVLTWMCVSRKLLTEVMLPGALSVDPEKAAGSYEEKLREQAAVYRQISTTLTESSPGEYWVGNPHDREETIELFIQPISTPLDWKVTIANAEQAGTAAQGKSRRGEPECPVREIEAGKHYAVTLPAHHQVKLLTTLAPVGAMGTHTTTRWAVEGRIGDELIGGVVHEMTLP